MVTWQGPSGRGGWLRGVLGLEVGAADTIRIPPALRSLSQHSAATSRVGASGSWRTAGPAVGVGGEEGGKDRGVGRLPEPFSTAGPILNPPAGRPCPSLPWSAGRAFGMKLLISSSSHPLSEVLTQRESTLGREVLQERTAAACRYPQCVPSVGLLPGESGGDC